MFSFALVASAFAPSPLSVAPIPAARALAAVRAPRAALVRLSADGGEPLPPEVDALLVGSEELQASRPGVCILWRLLLDVYPTEEAALSAVQRNSAIVLPYLNRPPFITGTWKVLNELMSEAEALDVVTKNPGILACNPAGLRTTNAGDIQRAAAAIDAVEQVPLAGRWALTAAAVFGVGSIVAAPLLSSGP